MKKKQKKAERCEKSRKMRKKEEWKCTKASQSPSTFLVTHSETPPKSLQKAPKTVSRGREKTRFSILGNEGM